MADNLQHEREVAQEANEEVAKEEEKDEGAIQVSVRFMLPRRGAVGVDLQVAHVASWECRMTCGSG